MRARERFEMLRELADTGMEMSRELRREVRQRAAGAEAADEQDSAARPGPPAASSGELSLAFSRVSRAVRQTLALEVRLEDDRKSAKGAAQTGDAWTQERVQGAAARLQARLWRIAHPDDDPDEEADEDSASPADLNERADDDEREDGGTEIPPDAALAGIRRDLGLNPDARRALWVDPTVEAIPSPLGTGDNKVVEGVFPQAESPPARPPQSASPTALPLGEHWPPFPPGPS